MGFGCRQSGLEALIMAVMVLCVYWPSMRLVAMLYAGLGCWIQRGCVVGPLSLIETALLAHWARDQRSVLLVLVSVLLAFWVQVLGACVAAWF